MLAKAQSVGRLMLAVLSPIPQLANWVPLLQPVIAVLTAVGLGVLVPQGALLALAFVAMLLFVAAFKLQLKTERYETPVLSVTYEHSDPRCNEEFFGANADNQIVRVLLLKRLLVRNLSKQPIEHVRLILENSLPSTGDVLHRQLDMMHDKQHEYATSGFPLAPEGREYVDVIVQKFTDESKMLQFCYAAGYGWPFEPLVMEVTISVQADTVSRFEMYFHVGIDGEECLTTLQSTPDTAGPPPQ